MIDFQSPDQAIAFTKTDEWDDGKRIHVLGTLTFSGNYLNGGEVPTTGSTNGIRARGSRSAPKWVKIEGKAGFEYDYDRANEKVMVRAQEPTNAGAGVIALSQLAAAAYPAGITGDVVDVYAIFDKYR